MCRFQTLSHINRNALQASAGFHAAYIEAFGDSSLVLMDSEARQANTVNRAKPSTIPLFYCNGSFRKNGSLVNAVFKLHYRNHNWLDFAVVDYPQLDLNASDLDFQESLGSFTGHCLSGSAGLIFESLAFASGGKLKAPRLAKSDPTHNRSFLEKCIGQAVELHFRGVDGATVVLGETFDAFKWSGSGWSGKPSVPAIIDYRRNGQACRDEFQIICRVQNSKNSKIYAELEFIDAKLTNHLRLPTLKAQLAPYLFTAVEK